MSLNCCLTDVKPLRHPFVARASGNQMGYLPLTMGQSLKAAFRFGRRVFYVGPTASGCSAVDILAASDTDQKDGTLIVENFTGTL